MTTLNADSFKNLQLLVDIMESLEDNDSNLENEERQYDCTRCEKPTPIQPHCDGSS